MSHSFLLRKLTIAGLLLCLITLSLAPACVSPGPKVPAAPSPQVATIVVTPVAVEQGKKFTVAGSGFEPDGLVTLTMAGVPLDLEKVYKGVKLTAGEEFIFDLMETNQFGAFVREVADSSIISAISTLKPGVYTIRAKDSKGTSATSPVELTAKKA